MSISFPHSESPNPITNFLDNRFLPSDISQMVLDYLKEGSSLNQSPIELDKEYNERLDNVAKFSWVMPKKGKHIFHKDKEVLNNRIVKLNILTGCFNLKKDHSSSVGAKNLPKINCLPSYKYPNYKVDQNIRVFNDKIQISPLNLNIWIEESFFNRTYKNNISIEGGYIKDYDLTNDGILFVATDFTLNVYDLNQNNKLLHKYDLQFDKISWDEKEGTLTGQQSGIGSKKTFVLDYKTGSESPQTTAKPYSHTAKKVAFVIKKILKTFLYTGPKASLKAFGRTFTKNGLAGSILNDIPNPILTICLTVLAPLWIPFICLLITIETVVLPFFKGANECIESCKDIKNSKLFV